jgi:ankyrin repeat protein
LWECGKETLNIEDLRNKWLVAKDNEEQTALHYALFVSHVQVLHLLWECGKETLTAEELSNKLLLAKHIEERTAWHLAARQ